MGDMTISPQGQIVFFLYLEIAVRTMFGIVQYQMLARMLSMYHSSSAHCGLCMFILPPQYLRSRLTRCESSRRGNATTDFDGNVVLLEDMVVDIEVPDVSQRIAAALVSARGHYCC